MKIQRYVLVGLCLLLPLESLAGNQSKVKSSINKGLNAAEGIPFVGSVVKTARKFIPGLSDEEKMVDLMKKQVKTSKTALEEMQELARSMLKLKKNVEGHFLTKCVN